MGRTYLFGVASQERPLGLCKIKFDIEVYKLVSEQKAYLKRSF